MSRNSEGRSLSGTTIKPPDISVTTVKWHALVKNLGNLPKRATTPEVETIRRALQSLLGVVRVDRDRKGHADLSIGGLHTW